MSVNISGISLPLTLIVIAILHFLTSSQVQGGRLLVVEEKTRLGSTPPSCYNKCNYCHPCMALQVPTMPNHHHHQYSSSDNIPIIMEDYSSNNNRYSNYKPLSWKCICHGHLFNP